MSRADEGGGVVTSHGELAAFACGLRKYPAGLRGEDGGTGSPVTITLDMKGGLGVSGR